tara:strand:- start:314 stop:631 length:318 start_codon:yes stop_codon:yes gene_type:complete
MSSLLYWDIYEVSSEKPLHGVKFRGRLRKAALKAETNLLVENNEHRIHLLPRKGIVRFALLHPSNADTAGELARGVVANVCVKLVAERVANPVLSKLRCNKSKRY